MRRESRRSDKSSASVPRNANSKSDSSRTGKTLAPSPAWVRARSRSQDFKKSIFAGVVGNCRGLQPVGIPFFKGRYSPPKARTRISRPRSLSMMTCVQPNLVSIEIKKPMMTVLPPPVGPQRNVWPTSRREPPSGSCGSEAWSEKKKGERAEVMRSVRASPQWLPRARPTG